MKVILIGSILSSSKIWNSVAHSHLYCRGQVPGVNPRSSRRAPTVLASTLLAVREWRGLRERFSAKQCRLKHERTNAPNIVSTARKDLSHLTCFNSDKKGHYATKCPELEEQRHLRKLVTVLVTSALKRLTWTLPQSYSRTSSLQLIPASIPER